MEEQTVPMSAYIEVVNRLYIANEQYKNFHRRYQELLEFVEAVVPPTQKPLSVEFDIGKATIKSLQAERLYSQPTLF